MKIKKRKLTRKFEFHFGKGVITEEVSIKCPYHEPTIQLLEFESGEKSLRFCVYHGNRFSRVPLIIEVKDLKRLKKEINKSIKIKDIFENAF